MRPEAQAAVEVLPTLQAHPMEDLLEEYAFARVAEPALSPLEEHLLLCSHCQSSLHSIDRHRMLMKMALTNYEVKAASAVLTRSRLKALWAAAALIVLVSGPIVWRAAWRTHANPSTVAMAEPVLLTALRGGSGFDGMAHAAGSRPLQLIIDKVGLAAPDTAGYRLQIVDASGTSRWSGPTRFSSDGKLLTNVPVSLAPGLYWVRLYASGDQLREFGLVID